MLRVRYPIFLNSNMQIQDQGGVVLGEFWRVGGDVGEVREWCERICVLVNGCGVVGGVPVVAEKISGNGDGEAGTYVKVLIPQVLKRRRGNPAWVKGMKRKVV